MNLGSDIYFSLAIELPGRLEKMHVLRFSLQTAQSQLPFTKSTMVSLIIILGATRIWFSLGFTGSCFWILRHRKR